jgi:plasmid stabilization system protein ParE
MTKLRLTTQARLDLQMIQDAGLADFGPRATRKHMAGFGRIFQLLRVHPSAGPARPEYGRDIRTFAHHPHRVIYRLQGNSILVVRILHHARDVRTALKSSD